MLMTKNEALTPLGELVLETVRAAGGVWLTRLDIAQRLGRPNKLTPHDIDVLNQLVALGLVERERRSRGLVQTEFIYRAK